MGACVPEMGGGCAGGDVPRGKRKSHEDSIGGSESGAADPLKQQKCHQRSESRKKRKQSSVSVTRKPKQKIGIEHEATQLVPQDPESIARRYQLEVLEMARKRNVIVYLETGLGKTLIAVLLIKDTANRLRDPLKKRVAVFLVPKVILAEQQLEVIRVHTNFKADVYYGAKGVDLFDLERWQWELNNHEVMVMTPQVFLDALRSAKLKMDSVELLILDECHHARKRSAYAKIMEEYYHTSEHKPKVLGLTASPGQQGAKTNCEESIKELERVLDAQVCTPKDRAGLELHVPSPEEQAAYYYQDKIAVPDAQLRALDTLREKYSVLGCDESTACEEPKFADEKEAAKRLKKHISKLHGSVLHCIEDLGHWCALKAVDRLLKEDLSPSMEYLDAELITLMKEKEKGFLKEALEVLHSVVGDDSLCNHLVTAKVKRLMEVLMGHRHTTDVRCIVFVERVIDTVGLSELVNCLSQLGSLSFFKCGYLTGSHGAYMDATTRKQQESVLRDFRSGKVNIVIATDVAEEGLDVQGCNLVIRFDLPKTVTSYIQSRGRARRPESKYIFLLQGHIGQEVKIRKLKSDEREMKSMTLDRFEEAVVEPLAPSDTGVLESYKVETTGAVVNMDSSVSVVYRYCSKLPKDKFYHPRPEFLFSKTEDGQHVCVLILPSNAIVHEVVGPSRGCPASAKKVVCLKACKILHQLGALDDHLVPVSDNDFDELPGSGKKKNQKRGIAKQKELHSSIVTEGLRGCWGNSKTGVLFDAYVMKFTQTSRDHKEYTDFVLLLESELHNNAAELVVRLTLRVGEEVTASLVPASTVHLEAKEVEDAKKFQELLFNGMFSKLVARRRNGCGVSSWTSSYLCPSEEQDKLWAYSRMYLLLPLSKRRDGALLKALQDQEQSSIDWESVQKGAHAADVLAQNRTANCSVSADHAEQVIGTAIVTRHTGKIYVVTKIREDISGHSEFPVNNNQMSPMTYEEFFKNKYGEHLKNPEHAFLQAKQSHKIRNMLIPSSQLVDTRKAGQAIKYFHAHLAPELCIPTGLKPSIINAAYLIPSVMHHLDALLQASQLQKEIASAVPHCPRIPLLRIVEALTTSRCLQGFSMERLEMLGDSFLKYAVTRHLFLKHQDKHEGQLSARRIRAISNTTLYQLSVARNLPAYIRDEVFNPKRWLAPGMRSRNTEICQCNLAELEVFSDQKTKVEQTCEPKTKTGFRKVGKSCIDGHRWLCLKTMADVVEALIGAYFISGGDIGALSFMRWVGVDVDYDIRDAQALREQVMIKPEVMESVHFDQLESCLGYVFRNKSLLLEAVTHASQQDGPGCRCYQRLEFLGDAVLDILISKHLFTAYPHLPPGRLSDLRSAAVNNGCFARVAVKHNLQHYLRHGSRALMSQIEHFVKLTRDRVPEEKVGSFGWERDSGPKVLGDIVESIAGAIVVDTGFDLEKTWGIMENLLAPIVTPTTLPVHPVRELQELCQSHGFSLHVQEDRPSGQELIIVTAKVTSGETVITEKSSNTNRKAARKDVAMKLLNILQNYRYKEAGCVGSLEDNMVMDCDAARASSQSAGEVVDGNAEGPLVQASDAKLCQQKHVQLVEHLNQQLLSSTVPEALVSVDKLESTEEVAIAVNRGAIPDSEEDRVDSQITTASDDIQCHTFTQVVVERESCTAGQVEEITGMAEDTHLSAPSTLAPQFTSNGLNYVKSLSWISMAIPDQESGASIEEPVQRGRSDQEGQLDGDAWAVRAEGFDEAASGIKRKLDFEQSSIMNAVKKVRPSSEELAAGVKRAKSELHELCAKRKWAPPEFLISKESGPPHMKRFTSFVRVHMPGGETLESEGTEKSDKKNADHSAAFALLEKLKSFG